jgi:hypothetical protein
MFDAKSAPPPAGRNLSIAVDLASFAVHGGRILFGLRQPSSTGVTTRAPFDLTGLPERLDQIARGALIDPPLRITCTQIDSTEQPGLGYLLVVIPRSLDAPHMVDGKYRGRADRTNTVLSDAEIRRLHHERSRGATDLRAVLDAEVARDPTSAELRTQSHLYVVGQPLNVPGDLLARAIGASDWRPWLRGGFFQEVMSIQQTHDFQPDLFMTAVEFHARVTGWAVSTYTMGPDRNVRQNGALPATEDDLLDLEVQDDGGLRLFCGRASYQSVLREGTRVNPGLIVTLTRRVIHAGIAVSRKADFLGEWGFGVAIREFGPTAHYAGPDTGVVVRTIGAYDEVKRVTCEELARAPLGLAKSLLTRYFRGRGLRDYLEGVN